eukprot:scaffold1124_cov131-Isochrysis_galbana.AAC.2
MRGLRGPRPGYVHVGVRHLCAANTVSDRCGLAPRLTTMHDRLWHHRRHGARWDICAVVPLALEIGHASPIIGRSWFTIVKPREVGRNRAGQAGVIYHDEILNFVGTALGGPSLVHHPHALRACTPRTERDILWRARSAQAAGAALAPWFRPAIDGLLTSLSSWRRAWGSEGSSGAADS